MYSNLSKRWMRDIPPLVMTGGTMLSGAIGLLLLSLIDPTTNRWGDVARLDAVQWLALVFLSLGCSVIAYFVYNVALTKIDASRVAVYIYFEPVVTVLLSMLLLGERLNWPTLGGALAIGVSVAAVNLLQRRGEPGCKHMTRTLIGCMTLTERGHVEHYRTDSALLTPGGVGPLLGC
jgi:drug/metabolite transporter (DMT)-like permease